MQEKMKIQLRADMLNVINRTNLGNPGTNIESATFGRITATRGSRAAS
jgi:hypothetical protein